METPKFSQLRLLYPGYPEYGGHYHYDKLMFFILGPVVTDGDSSADALQLARHHTAAVRMSYALNRYGGRHAIGTEPIQLTRHPSSPVDSFAGRDRQQVIFRNEAFGPFLAARYGNPEVVRTATDDDSGITNRKPSSSAGLMSQFAGRQGIVRIVSFRRHNENGHVALWDCDRFYQSRDWSNEDHVIAVEFWESAGWWQHFCRKRSISFSFVWLSTYRELCSVETSCGGKDCKGFLSGLAQSLDNVRCELTRSIFPRDKCKTEHVP